MFAYPVLIYLEFKLCSFLSLSFCRSFRPDNLQERTRVYLFFFLSISVALLNTESLSFSFIILWEWGGKYCLYDSAQLGIFSPF